LKSAFLGLTRPRKVQQWKRHVRKPYCTALRGLSGLLQAEIRVVKCITRWQCNGNGQWQRQCNGKALEQAIARNGIARSGQWQCNMKPLPVAVFGCRGPLWSNSPRGEKEIYNCKFR
jgi:hypothetical protein